MEGLRYNRDIDVRTSKGIFWRGPLIQARNHCGREIPYEKALITGITGQDGSDLAEFLLDRGYEVHGIVRRVAIEDPEHRLWRIRTS